MSGQVSSSICIHCSPGTCKKTYHTGAGRWGVDEALYNHKWGSFQFVAQRVQGHRKQCQGANEGCIFAYRGPQSHRLPNAPKSSLQLPKLTFTSKTAFLVTSNATITSNRKNPFWSSPLFLEHKNFWCPEHLGPKEPAKAGDCASKSDEESNHIRGEDCQIWERSWWKEW